MLALCPRCGGFKPLQGSSRPHSRGGIVKVWRCSGCQIELLREDKPGEREGRLAQALPPPAMQLEPVRRRGARLGRPEVAEREWRRLVAAHGGKHV